MLITVIGAASIDIFVRSKHPIIPGESNPAGISLRAGGEARNIASMLVSRGAEVNLITAVGDDALGVLLKESCSDLGINTDAWIIKSHMCTCVNLETLESNGKLHTAFNAMTVPEAIKTSELARFRSHILEADLLILDLNITEKILAAALEMRCGRPVLVDSVSASKAMRIGNLLDKVDILKLNRRQAESLTGIPLDSKERVKFACNMLVDRGVGRVFCTLGVAGACASDEHNTIFIPTQPVAVKDIAGAGAAFVTGLALGMAYDIRTQAEQGVSYALQHLEAYAKRKPQ